MAFSAVSAGQFGGIFSGGPRDCCLDYRYDRPQDQYAHPAAIMVLTPDGKIARYLYGIRFRPVDLRFALAEASEGRMTLTVQKILLLCYHYDPLTGKYNLAIFRILRAAGALTVLASRPKDGKSTWTFGAAKAITEGETSVVGGMDSACDQGLARRGVAGQGGGRLRRSGAGAPGAAHRAGARPQQERGAAPG